MTRSTTVFSCFFIVFLSAALWTSVGCAKPVYNLASIPKVPATRFQTPLILRIPPVLDSRPRVEKEGDSASLHVLLPFLPLFLYIESRGSDMTGNENFRQPPAEAMHHNLLAYFNASKTFASVTAGGSAHLELQVELLHLYSHRYRTGWGFGSGGGGVSTTDFFSYNANVVMRLRLVDLTKGGATIMERVVHGTSADVPNAKNRYGPSIFKAVEKSLGKAWYWTLAATREIIDTQTEAEYLTWYHKNCPMGKACRFNVIRIGRFHEAVDLVTIDMDTGNIVNKNRISNLRITPPGKAGEWLLSPWDHQGFPLPSNLYNALAKFVTQRGFIVRRLDHFSVYHFFGVRKTSE